MNSSSRRTEGATLFVVVLMVLFLLAAIMAITAQLTLSGRKSAGDQENTLRAQYAAESTMSRAQAQMNMLGQVLNGGIAIPAGTDSTVIAGYIKNLCGMSAASSLPPASGVPGTSTLVCGTTDPTSNLLQGITSPASLATRLSLFTATVPSSNAPYISDTVLARAGALPTGSSLATKQAFWARMFGGSTGTDLATNINGLTTQGTVGATLTSVYRLTGDEYQIRIRVPDVNVRATSTTSARALKVSPQGTEYALYVGRGPLAKYALFTNHHFSDAAAEAGRSRITFTSNTNFSGPVHTNQQFNFQGNPTFSGPVTSAGCVAGGIMTTTNADGTTTDSCRSTVGGQAGTQPGAYFYNTNFAADTSTTLSNTDGSYKTNPRYSSGSNTSSPTFSYTPPATTDPLLGGAADPINWNASFQQLPRNSNDQIGAAQNGGLYINSTVTNMSLAVGTSGVTNGMQLISYTKSGGNPVNLAVSNTGAVLIQSGTNYVPAVQVTSGEWVAAAGATGIVTNTFNGVIYVNSTTGISNLNGPARNPANATTSTSANTPPAIASFMQMNITSNGDIGITSDLRYQRPLVDDAGNPIPANATAPNILGIYSSANNVTIGTSSTTVNTPKNIAIHAVLMASQGSVNVPCYTCSSSNNLGNVNLLGGIIENYYGVFGQTSGTGYGRSFTYDTRTAQGVLPPAFPTTQNWSSYLIYVPAGTSAPLTTSRIYLNTGPQVQQSNAQYRSDTGNR